MASLHELRASLLRHGRSLSSAKRLSAVSFARELTRLHRCRCFGTVVMVDSSSNEQRDTHRASQLFAGGQRKRSIVREEISADGGGGSSSRSRSSRAAKDSIGRAGVYPLPTPYAELFEQLDSQDSQSTAADFEQDDPQELRRGYVRNFWKRARKVAKQRLEAQGPDPTHVQKRAASLHESLWVEELSARLELQRWRTTTHEIPCIGDGLYQLNVGEIHDQTGLSTGEQGLLRGVRLEIKCGNGEMFRASVQPGSTSGVLLLSAPIELSETEGPFDVEFHPHRFPQLAMHRALDTVQAEQILAEDLSEKGGPAAHSSVAGQQTSAEETMKALPASLNSVQKRAVAASLEPGPQIPLVIWGPPGTGKSTLAAFIVWHLVQQRPTGLHVLVTAPSNTGADVLCSKLAKLGLDEGRMFRLNALGRSFNTVPEDLRRFCQTSPGDDGRPSFVVPDLHKLRSIKVVVTTCICASHLANALRREGGQSGWFSHVIVDEAGEATEPETLVPLSLLRPVAGRIILMGDHFQLGPLVLSSLASQLGRLDESMIERLANQRFRSAQSPETQTGLNRDILLECESRGLFFLTESFRSHPAIMAMYSEVFYAGQLEHKGRPQQLGLLPFFESQGCANAPVILHNVLGTERREPGSASPYNADEVRVVQGYIIDLIEHGSLQPADIGIITPYARQVQALQRQIESLGDAFAGIEVGTVEHFQGQERKAVILSTVRTAGSANSGEGTQSVSRRPIGFLADPRRLNVAVSRAVAGLVIVGDLDNLSKYSSDWRAIIQMGQDAGYIRGEPLESHTLFKKLQAHGLHPAVLGQIASDPVPAEKVSAAWDTLTQS
eukprot:TRINITY_DN14618_c0_g3_i4.p1 TRINITY_DN14618_c0_g3~~TRINITY_DN14618_c0_g3_i4.p1  ORF type:complete len:837 (+),score=141.02 TRINITY_DN14618_c0_g3_i4:28-2538(+)